MILKDLENILQGSIKFILQRRNSANEIENVDTILPCEIRYLPAKLRLSNVLRIDLDDKIIFLNNTNEDSEKWTKSEIDESMILESLETDIKKSIDDNNLI